MKGKCRLFFVRSRPSLVRCVVLRFCISFDHVKCNCVDDGCKTKMDSQMTYYIHDEANVLSEYKRGRNMGSTVTLSSFKVSYKTFLRNHNAGHRCPSSGQYRSGHHLEGARQWSSLTTFTKSPLSGLASTVLRAPVRTRHRANPQGPSLARAGAV